LKEQGSEWHTAIRPLSVFYYISSGYMAHCYLFTVLVSIACFSGSFIFISWYIIQSY